MYAALVSLTIDPTKAPAAAAAFTTDRFDRTSLLTVIEFLQKGWTEVNGDDPSETNIGECNSLKPGAGTEINGQAPRYRDGPKLLKKQPLLGPLSANDAPNIQL